MWAVRKRPKGKRNPDAATATRSAAPRPHVAACRGRASLQAPHGPSEQAPRPGRTHHEAFPARLPLRQHPQQQEQGPPPPRYLAVHFSPPLRRDPRTRLPRGPAYSSAAGSGHRPRLPPATTERRNGRNTQSRTSGWAGRVVHRTGGSGRKSRGHARSRAAHAPRMLRVWLLSCSRAAGLSGRCGCWAFLVSAVVAVRIGMWDYQALCRPICCCCAFQFPYKEAEVSARSSLAQFSLPQYCP